MCGTIRGFSKIVKKGTARLVVGHFFYIEKRFGTVWYGEYENFVPFTESKLIILNVSCNKE